MPVETDADRAALFSDAGEAAVYTPPAGPPVACVIVYHRGRPQPFEFGPGGDSGMRGAYALQGALILVDQVPLVEQGGTIAIGFDTLRVVSRPELDETGAIWTVDLQKVAP